MANTKAHIYSDVEKEYLASIIPGRSYEEVRQLFNRRFVTSLTINQIAGELKRLGLKNGRQTRFYKGQRSWNEGRKGIRMSPHTEFKAGHMPHNHKPVGTERISKDGYLEVKVAESKKWMGKHRIVWEQHNGPVPKGHVVVFADSDKMNFCPDNLILVSRAELAILNKRGMIFDNADATKSGVLVAKVIQKIGERK